jgi:histidyl-tRNA synthetase
MTKSYKSIRGTYDYSPTQAILFNEIIQKARNIFKTFAYEEVILPVLEEEGVFTRSVGETTDIVEKQIFRVFRRESEETNMVLRPEGTAQVIRYYLENSLHKQTSFHKFFYIGPMFRGERPQKGRLRQFNHIGAEAIGSNSAFLDAEIISLSLKILDKAGLKEKQLHINTLGCLADKEKFIQALKKGLDEKKCGLCQDCQRRLDKNSLRILDCRQEGCRNIARAFCSAQISERPYLCSECKKNFLELQKILNDNAIAFTYNPCLVRGLDYYTNTVFEISSPGLGSQDAVGAGGRYNNLIKTMAGPGIPACGFALGVERMMLALKVETELEPLSVFVAVIGEKLTPYAYKILENLRSNNIRSDMDYCAKSLKAQLRYAEKRKANFVIIAAEEELKEGFIVIKDMAKSSQEKVKENDLIQTLRGYLAEEEGVA